MLYERRKNLGTQPWDGVTPPDQVTDPSRISSQAGLLKTLEGYFRALPPPPRSITAYDIVRPFVADSAALAFANVEQAEDVFTNDFAGVTQLVNRLALLCNAPSQTALIGKWRTLRQGANESVDAFFGRSTKLTDGMVPKPSVPFLVGGFADGLRPHLKPHLPNQLPDDMFAMLQLARVAEAKVSSAEAGGTTYTMSAEADTHGEESLNYAASHAASGRGGASGHRGGGQSRGVPRGVCWRCGKPGHVSRDCTAASSTSTRGGYDAGRGRGRGGGGSRGGHGGRGGGGGGAGSAGVDFTDPTVMQALASALAQTLQDLQQKASATQSGEGSVERTSFVMIEEGDGADDVDEHAHRSEDDGQQVADTVMSASAERLDDGQPLRAPTLWMFAASFNGRAVVALADSGATMTSISQQLADSYPAWTQAPATPVKVRVASGELLVSTSVVIGTLRTSCGHTEDLRCRVLPTNAKVDLILGTDWFRHHEVTLQYQPAGLWLARDQRRIPTQSDISRLREQSHEVERVEAARGTHTAEPLLEHELSLLDSLAGQAPRDGYSTAEIVERYAWMKNFGVTLGTDPNAPAWHASQVPHRPGFDHAIHTVSNDGLKPRPNRLDQEKKLAVRTWLEANLASGVLVAVASPWASPLVLVKKKNDTWRVCGDFRALNQITLPDHQPMPRIDELFLELRNARVMSLLDLKEGYYQLRLRDEDQAKTAIVTDDGTFAFTVMPFGLSTAPQSFMRFMTHVLREFLRTFVIVYLDDILIYSSSVEEHQTHVRLVLETLSTHRLRVNTDKCRWFCGEVTFLGFQISEHGRAPTFDKLAALRAWPVPVSAKALRSFVGFVGYYQSITPNFATIMLPLYDLLRTTASSKHAPWAWGEEHLAAFNRIKASIAGITSVAIPNPRRPFRLRTDASDVAIGAVLEQRRPGGDSQRWWPVAFMSLKLNDTQRRYRVHERELLAIVTALDKFQFMLGLATVFIVTDNKSLESLSTAPNLTDRMFRWAMAIDRFRRVIKYVPGNENVAADALSRCEHGDTLPLETSFEQVYVLVAERGGQGVTVDGGAMDAARGSELQFECLLRAECAGKQAQWDEFVVSQGAHSNKSTNVAVARAATPQLRTENGLWWRGKQLVLPKASELRVRVLFAAHDDSGHMGVDKTLELIQRYFWWPRLSADVREYVETCVVCQRGKSSTQRPGGTLRPIPPARVRFGEITMDFVEPGIVCRRTGCDFILVIVDRFTKTARFIATKKTVTGQEVAQLVCKEWVRQFGVPERIITDRDPRWTGEWSRGFWSAFGTATSFSTAFHPQTDGQTEAVNKVLGRMLRALPEEQRGAWDAALWLCEMAYNNSRHASTRYSPFYLTYGMHPRGPLSGMVERLRLTKADAAPRLFDELRKLEAALSAAYENVGQASARQEHYANEKRREVVFKEGDQVLLSTKNMNVGKLEPRYDGPFKVRRMIGEVAAELELPAHWRRYPVFHVSLLRPWKESESFATAKRTALQMQRSTGGGDLGTSSSPVDQASGVGSVGEAATRRVQPERASKRRRPE
jgi:Reverse transcriptase (RNA-dependent DNA polymerase)/RNase H-like domain found in reverse transcriptase/Integrase zinc binding domain/gag-polyprotein putative aspartyl protease/Zinc knuckle